MKKGFKWTIANINIVGLLCLIYYSIPYLTHSTLKTGKELV